MKKRNLLYTFLLFAFVLTGCENFLDSTNLTQKNTSNYPESADDASDMLTGVYTAARYMANDDDARCSMMFAEILSDDRFVGGGPDDADWHALERFEFTNVELFDNTWANAYRAIFRANMLFETIDNVDWAGDTAKRNHIAGQAYFLRGYTYFYLAQMFGTAPVIPSTQPINLPRATVDEMYAQITSDLLTAIENMNSEPRAEVGRASKWAAEALLARVYLFYTGCYDKAELPLPEGATLSKAKVIDYLDDCIKNSGFDLIGDFRNLWPYSNIYSQQDEEIGYPYATNNGLHWIGEEGDNIENVFCFTCSADVTWDNSQDRNIIDLFCSMRDQDTWGIYPFGLGYGFGTVNPNFWDSWPDNDIRKRGSILDVSDPEEMQSYQWAADRQQQETGYWSKKYCSFNYMGEVDGELKPINYGHAIYGDVVDPDYQINNSQDIILIRFADILLMAAELKQDAAPLNRVRARVGLPAVSYSDNALRNERHWELAFEGLRYYDLLRWHMAGEALTKQNGVSVKNDNKDVKMQLGDVAKRIQETGGFLPIPPTQIKLSNGTLKQTPGW